MLEHDTMFHSQLADFLEQNLADAQRGGPTAPSATPAHAVPLTANTPPFQHDANKVNPSPWMHLYAELPDTC